MKKIIFELIVFSSLGISAQSGILLTNLSNSTALPPNAVINMTVAANGTALNNIDIKNTSGTTNSYRLKRYSVQLNANGSNTATPYFIYNGVQYPAGTSTSVVQLTL